MPGTRVRFFYEANWKVEPGVENKQPRREVKSRCAASAGQHRKCQQGRVILFSHLSLRAQLWLKAAQWTFCAAVPTMKMNGEYVVGWVLSVADFSQSAV